LGESFGIDSVWLEEHHSIRDHYWPSPLVALAGLATRTEHILIGTDIAVMPFYHPVRLAEDSAMLDVMSRGRFILGVAIGYHPGEFALYQVPMELRGARLDEGLQLIRKLWREEKVSFSGRFFNVENGTIEPRPSSDLSIWLGGWGELALKRAARLADAWLPGPTADLEKLLQAQALYHQNLEELGIPPESRPMPITREIILATSDSLARKMAQEHLMISYRDEYGGGKWKHPLIGNQDDTPVDQFEALSRNRFLIGSPDTVISQIKRFREIFKMDHLICRMYFPGIPHKFILQEIELLAKEVIPAFR
jgi:alkanesulfonate monooxygenase SsuD/methylene tetrahydromethanopterin reductase-like flavin-dependent oxidoreductase (luciferase family)